MDAKKYYANYAYNKGKKNKFFVLFSLLVVCLGLVIGAFIAIQQWQLAIVLVIVLVFMATLIPSVIKSYPTKIGQPIITVEGKEITVEGKKLTPQEIETVVVTVLLPEVSKKKEENHEYCVEMSKQMPEEPVFGTVDIYLKAGPKVKKGTALYTTVEDCIGACISMVDAGVRSYSIFFSLKKSYERAQFSITKEDKKKQSLSDVSEKERKKQLL